MIQDEASLADIAAKSKDEKIASEALGRIHDDMALADAAAMMSDEQTALDVVSRITDADVLRRLCKQDGSSARLAPVCFEAGRRLGDVKTCVAALDKIVDKGADDVKTSLDSIEDKAFQAEVVKRWIIAAFPAEVVKRQSLGLEVPQTILEKLAGKPIIEPPVGDALEGYLCPNGSVHDYDSTTMHFAAGSDDYYGVVWCRSCGYRYEVDKVAYMRKEHLFGCEDKKVVCKPGGYLCPRCHTAVQPEGDNPAPCVCPNCGAESHDWEHYDGEIVHRDYSSGTSYDYCKRCGKKKNIVSHDTW